MSTAQDLPLPYGEPTSSAALRLVPSEPLDFDDAVRRVRPRLQRYAVRRLGDMHEAEELVQEALLRAYANRDQLLTEDDLAAWATVVTGRLVIDRLRVRGRSTAVAEVPEGSRVGRDTAEVVVARDEARLALDALDAMPTRQAALLWAREVEGSTYEDLCARFSMSEPAVRSVLTRARKSLRKEYAARGGTLPVGGLALLAPWITGLTWADRLRRAATRGSAPAALSMVGITALGGLVLSPFGWLPPTTHGYAPAQAVVATPLNDTVERRVPVVAPPFPHVARTRATTPRRQDALSRLIDHAKRSTPCVNDTDNSGEHPSTELPYGQSVVWAGSPNCAKTQGTQGSTLYVTPALPDNPSGVTHPGVNSDYIDCTKVPGNPVVTCTPDSTPHKGALQ